MAVVITFILNEAPYGSEKSYNALRLAMALQKDHTGVEIRIFLMADAVTCALANQSTPDGYYNVERMLRSVIHRNGQVRLCGTCCEARGLKGLAQIEGAEIGSTAELARWTVESDRVLTF